MNFENILLFEASSEAIEAVKSKNAIISSGGIRRRGENGKGFLEQVKPAFMTVNDFKELFESKEHGTIVDEHLTTLETRLNLSDEGMKEIEKMTWLNNTAIQRVYTMTFDGFCEVIREVENITAQLSEFEKYVIQRDLRSFKQEAKTYISNLKSAAGDMRSKHFDFTNSNVAELLDRIAAFIKRLLEEITDNNNDVFVPIQILLALLKPFAYVVRKFSALYYYENDSKIFPGNYEEWIDTIEAVNSSKIYKDKLFYYIRLRTTLSFKDKASLFREEKAALDKLLKSTKFDHQYVMGHSKEEYMNLEEQICKKYINQDYYTHGRYLVIFLDNNEKQIEKNG